MEAVDALQFRYWSMITAIIFLRYVLIAGACYAYFYGVGKKAWAARRLQEKFPTREQIGREIALSLRTLGIYSIAVWFFLDWLLSGITRHYARVADMGWGYLLGSFLAMVVMHDAYFYWTHRLMHHPRLFRLTHLTHHRFPNPSPWCAFAFHPLEAIISMGIIPLIVFLMPWHYLAFGAFITFMCLYDVYIHLGYRLPGTSGWKIGYTSQLHDLHHAKGHGNFGLYFTFWDRLMNTYRQEPEKGRPIAADPVQ